MTQDERWQQQYEQMMAFMNENHRRENVYIKSTMAEVQPEEFKSIMAQAGHWYRFYGKETNNEK